MQTAAASRVQLGSGSWLSQTPLPSHPLYPPYTLILIRIRILILIFIRIRILIRILTKIQTQPRPHP